MITKEKLIKIETEAMKSTMESQKVLVDIKDVLELIGSIEELQKSINILQYGKYGISYYIDRVSELEKELRRCQEEEKHEIEFYKHIVKMKCGVQNKEACKATQHRIGCGKYCAIPLCKEAADGAD